MGPPRCIAIPAAAWDSEVVVLDIGIDFRYPAAVEHTADFWQALTLVEHKAVVVGGVHGECRSVYGIHDVGVGQRPVTAARATGFPAPLVDPVAERPCHRVELVPDCRRDPRPRDQDHQADDRDDQDVLYCRLSSQAAGKSARYPPPKGISAACMCGSLRIGLQDRLQLMNKPFRTHALAAAATLQRYPYLPAHFKEKSIRLAATWQPQCRARMKAGSMRRIDMRGVNRSGKRKS